MIRQSSCLLLLALCCLQPCNGGPVRNPRQSDDSNNCGHPFHSFLCNKAPRSRVFNTPQSAASAISSFVAVPTKSAPSYEPPIEGENSFLDPTFITTTTTRKLSTTVRTTTARSVPIISGDSSIADPVFLRPRPSLPPQRPRPLEAQAAVLSPVKTLSRDNELCSHPFHSFLCQPGRRSGSRRIITGKLPPSYKGENSFLDPVSIKTTTALPPPPPVEVPEASFQSPSFYKPTQKTTQKPTSTTPRPTQQRTTPRPTITTTTPKPITPELQPEVPEASFDSPSFFKPEPPRTTQPPRTTARFLSAAPQQIVVVTAQPEHYKGQNPCDHAFHSYLCQPGSGSRRRNYGRAPVQPSASNQQPAVIRPVTTTTTTTRAPEVPEYSFLDAVAIKSAPTPRRPPPPPPTTTTTTTRKPTTTPRATPRPTPRPTTPPPPPIEAAPSSDIFSGILPPKPVIQASANTVKKTVEVVDKCKHAFHSFLCQPARPRKMQFQPAPSNIEGSLLLPAFRTTTTQRPTQAPTRPPPPPTRPPPPPPTRAPVTRPPPTRAPITRPPTTRPPPTTEEVAQFPDASFQDPQRIALPVPNRDPPAREPFPAPSSQLQNELLPAQFVRGPTDIADKCSHSFHGFLCKKAPRARRPIRIN